MPNRPIIDLILSIFLGGVFVSDFYFSAVISICASLAIMQNLLYNNSNIVEQSESGKWLVSYQLNAGKLKKKSIICFQNVVDWQ